MYWIIVVRFATAIILRKYDVFVAGRHVFYQKKTYTISLILKPCRQTGLERMEVTILRQLAIMKVPK